MIYNRYIHRRWAYPRVVLVSAVLQVRDGQGWDRVPFFEEAEGKIVTPV
jgi:hypothetical protein